jgi:hypothetical protein
VRWSHLSGKGAITKGGSVTKPAAVVPRRPRDRATARRGRIISARISYESKFQHFVSKNIFIWSVSDESCLESRAICKIRLRYTDLELHSGVYHMSQNITFFFILF